MLFSNRSLPRFQPESARQTLLSERGPEKKRGGRPRLSLRGSRAMTYAGREGGEMFIGIGLAKQGGGHIHTEPAQISELKAGVSPGRPGREAGGASSGRSRPGRRRAGKGMFVGLGEQALGLFWEGFLLGLMNPCYSPRSQPGSPVTGCIQISHEPRVALGACVGWAGLGWGGVAWRGVAWRGVEGLTPEIEASVCLSGAYELAGRVNKHTHQIRMIKQQTMGDQIQ